MASIEQVVSEIAHSVQQANSVPVRRAIRLSVIHNRNKLIRQSFERHGYTDKVLQQRFRITLIDCPDGDVPVDGTRIIKRSTSRVPRPTRLDNNLPFLSVRTTGVHNPIEIPFVKEAGSKFYRHLPGMCRTISYDLINQYLYIDITKNSDLAGIGSVIIESPFEYPTIIDDEETVYSGIKEEHFDGDKTYSRYIESKVSCILNKQISADAKAGITNHKLGENGNRHFEVSAGVHYAF